MIYKKGNPIWATMTQSPNSRLVIQADGNVVIYDQQSHALWATNTKGR